MPLFDTIGSDKYCVVFEFGNSFTKCGFAHEYSPRVFERSEEYDAQGQLHNLFKVTDEQLLFELLKNFVEKLYFRYLAINPKDRKVIIAESLFETITFKKVLYKVFFEYFNVPALLLVPQHLVALMTLQISTGLVIDIGHGEASVLPVVEGVSLLNAANFASLGGKAVDDRVKELMIMSGASIKICCETRSVQEEDLHDVKLLEEIKLKLCFVCPFTRSQHILQHGYAGMRKYPKDVLFTIKGDKLLTVPGEVRERSCEILFEQQAHEQNLPKLVLDCILACPMDLRKSLAANLVVIGGGSMLPGLLHRLHEELRQLIHLDPHYSAKLKHFTFKFHSLPCKENYASWLGASILGVTEMVNIRALTREQYSKADAKRISDWSNWWPE